MFPAKENDRGNQTCIAFVLERRMPTKTKRQHHVAYSLQEAERMQQAGEEVSRTRTMEVTDEIEELVGSTDALDTDDEETDPLFEMESLTLTTWSKHSVKTGFHTSVGTQCLLASSSAFSLQNISHLAKRKQLYWLE